MLPKASMRPSGSVISIVERPTWLLQWTTSARPTMLSVFRLIGRTNDMASSEVASALPAGSVVQMAHARGASASSA